jgi:Zn-dependent metalloprotease
LVVGENLVVKDVIKDSDGSTHVRYNRTFNGLRVIGGDLVSHRDKTGQIKSVDWSSHKVAVASMTPKVALASAKVAGANGGFGGARDHLGQPGRKVVYAGDAPPGWPTTC